MADVPAQVVDAAHDGARASHHRFERGSAHFLRATDRAHHDRARRVGDFHAHLGDSMHGAGHRVEDQARNLGLGGADALERAHQRVAHPVHDGAGDITRALQRSDHALPGFRHHVLRFFPRHDQVLLRCLSAIGRVHMVSSAARVSTATKRDRCQEVSWRSPKGDRRMRVDPSPESRARGRNVPREGRSYTATRRDVDAETSRP